MACSTPIPHDGSQYHEKKTRMCRFFLGVRGCRDGDDCLYKHVDDRQTCKYYFSKWGCWNGKWCQYRHSDPESDELETSKQFYNELNQWLGPAKTADDSSQSMDESRTECSTPKPVVVTIPAATKKFVSRGTQTKTTPDFVHCGECGEEFKSSRTLQQSLERHYIHKLASADFHHLRFFKRHAELQGGEPYCNACGEVFGSITEMLQHMGRSVSFTSGTASASVRHSHQSTFKQLVQPFVYRDLEVLETEDDVVQSILDIYYFKSPTTPGAVAAKPKTTVRKLPSTVSPMKLARKLQQEVNGTLENVSPYIHCESCGEIFDDPDSDEKLRDHYADMLTRADGLHVRQLRKWGNKQAHCSVCEKSLPSMVALLQHVGSKERVTGSNNRQSAANHSHLLNEIADIFVGRDLGVEGYMSEADVRQKLQELTWTADPSHPHDVPSADVTADDSNVTEAEVDRDQERRDSTVSNEPQKKEGVDEALQMARYFCRVNEWQAKMSYPEYVKDDQERTRNYGFTVAEVGYLATKGLTPTSRGVFNILNALYRRRRNPLKSVPVKAKEEPPKDKEVKVTAAAAKSPKKDVSFSEKTEELKTKRGQENKEGGKDAKEDSKEPVEEEEQVSPTKGQQPKPKRKKRVRRRKRSKGGVTDPDDEVEESEEKPSSSKNKAASADKEKKVAKDNVRRKRERLLSREIEGEELKVTMQVHMDGTIFIREKLAEAEEEVVPKNTTVDLTLQEAVDQSLHAGASITSRVFVVHDDGTIDVVLHVAGIPMEATLNTPAPTGGASKTVTGGEGSPQRDCTQEDSAIIAAKVSPRSDVVVYKEEGDMKTQILQYLLTATTEEETSVVKETKDEDAAVKPVASTPVEHKGTESGEVAEKVEEGSNAVVEEVTGGEKATSESKPKEQNTVQQSSPKEQTIISESGPKEKKVAPETVTNQQDPVVEQPTQPKTPAVAKPADVVTSSNVTSEESKPQSKPCKPIPAEDKAQEKEEEKENGEAEFCMVAPEDVSESDSQKAVPATGSEASDAQAPTDINGNADPGKMEKGKIVTEVNNNTETVAVTTAPSECRI